MKLPEFEYVEPGSVREACALLAGDPGSAVIAGGTDVLVNLKERLVAHRRLVSLRRIDALAEVHYSPESGLSIGATATVARVARHDAVQRHYPGIVDAALSLAAEQVRTLATVGGNLCSAVPSADMAPILLAHDAVLRIASPQGERHIPLRGFFTGPRRTVLGAGDVLLAIELAPPRSGEGAASVRQGGRAALSLPIAAVAAVLVMEGDVCREATVTLGAVAPTPMLASEAGQALAGQRLTPEVLARAGELAAAASRPIGDVRSPREYRLELVQVLTQRVVQTAAVRAGRG